MAVKITKLKTEKVRATIPVVVEGRKEEIKIFNPTPEQRVYFFEKLEDKVNNAIDENGELHLTADEVLRIFYVELTDLVIDDEDSVIEVLANPSKEILLVAQHINQIVHELVMEMMINKQLELNKIQEFRKQGELIESTKELLNSVGLTDEMLKDANLDVNKEIIKPLATLVEEELEKIEEEN